MSVEEKKNPVSKVFSASGNFSFLGTSTRVTEKSASLMGTANTTHSIFIQEYSLRSEFNLLKHHVETGVYVIPAAKTPFIWFGVIFIRNGIYEGGIFRFRLFIPREFPNCIVCPKVVFETPVFHPYVQATTGELFLKNSSFFEWRKDVNHLWQVIHYVKSIFYNISTENPTNKDAAIMYDTNREEFLKMAKGCVETSKVRIYEKPLEDDPHYLIFDEYNPQIHHSFKEIILKERSNYYRENDEPRSISWVQPGSLEPLSKQDIN